MTALWPPYVTPEDWRDDAACRDTPTGMFFDMWGHNERDAKRLCAACPVKAKCLDAAMRAEKGVREVRYRIGIWGGTNGDERAALERARREEAACMTSTDTPCSTACTPPCRLCGRSASSLRTAAGSAT